MAPRFLTAEWRDLAMVNYEVDPAILADLVPEGTEIDAWRGRTLVSMVGFRFLKTRVLGIPVPGHRDFDEVNLRFYVRRKAPEGWRRGVVFVKEIVPRPAIAWLARTLYNENYVALPMHHDVAAWDGAPERRVRYEWFHTSRWCKLEVIAIGAPELPHPESEEVFITEHYWGYAKQNCAPTQEYQVEHAQWRVSRGKDAVLSCDVGALYGPRFSEFLNRAPTSAFVADGSPVLVRKGVALRDGAV
jgi:uncharacterized protein YqjF (DUF2071 family)